MRTSIGIAGAIVASIIASAAPPAIAHDFWIEAATYRPAPNTRVPLTLHVGNDFKGDSTIFNAEYFNRYIVAGPDGERNVEGQLGDDPAGRMTIGKPGLYAVMYDSRKFDVTFDDFNKFEDYLKEEGLERQLAFARARGAGKITEMYSRCAKALVAAGPQGESALADRNFKCALELVAENNPYAMKPGGELRLRLLFREQPVEGVLVVAFNKADPATKLKVRTDRDGRVVMPLGRAGVWLVKAVNMIVMPRLQRGDWESFWASLTFELPGPVAQAR